MKASLTYKKVSEDSVDLLFTVTNTTDEEQIITFRSGQRYDYVLYRDGQLIERFSEGKMFIMIYEELPIAPGESMDFLIPLQNLEPGNYKVKVWLADRDWPTLRESVEFTI